MFKHLLRPILISFLLIYICIGFSSCLSVKQVKLFRDIPDTTALNSIKLPKFVPPLIHPGDVLSILIVTTEPTATASIGIANSFTPVNTAGGSATGTTSATSDNGFLVDKEGDIEMPEIGKIRVAGLTTEDAREVIRKKAEEYLKNPLVLIKNKTLKITILGEVTRPGVYTVSNEKLTILDVLSYSGDFTVYGRRDDILLLRQNENNTFSTIRLNLQDKSVLSSPNYYLQNNDVIYVEPNPGKAAASDVIFSRNLNYITIGIGFLTTILLIVKR